MILRISLLLLLLLTLPAAYIYRHTKSRAWRVVLIMPNALLLAATAYLACSDHRINENAPFVAVYLVALLGITLPEALYTIFAAAGSLFKRRAARRIGKVVGGAAAAVAVGVLAVAVATCFRPPRVNRHEFASPTLPQAFDGYKIVQVSDLHLGTFVFHPMSVSRIVSTVNSENADLVAFTGDLVNFDGNEIAPFRKDLAAIRARDGVVAVMGNHDYLMYVKFKGDPGNARHIAALQDEERAAGWKLLLNSHTTVRRGNDSIVVAGSENDGKKPFPSRGDLKKALQGTEKGSFKLLLTHDPSQWRREVLPHTDIQLTLSGHTHAGQVKILGHSPSEIAYKEWNGLYYSGGRAIHVSSGLGEALVPLRLGAEPCIDVITLRKSH